MFYFSYDDATHTGDCTVEIANRQHSTLGSDAGRVQVAHCAQSQSSENHMSDNNTGRIIADILSHLCSVPLQKPVKMSITVKIGGFIRRIWRIGIVSGSE